MQPTMVIVIVTLTLGLGYGPALAQTDAGWLLSIHMFDALTGWAVEAEGGSGVVAKGAVESVVRTTDGGIHWRDVTPHAPPGQKITPAFQVEWLNSLVAWVAAALDTPTHDTLFFHTVDGGRTWRIAPSPVAGLFHFINAREGWMLSIEGSIAREYQAAIYRSTDSGVTWTKIASARFVGQFPEVTFLNATMGWVTPWRTYGVESVFLYVTNDGGHTWRQQNLPLPLHLMLVPQTVDTRPPTFFTAQDGVLPVLIGNKSQSRFVLYLTHDGGTTWTYSTPVSICCSSSFADVNHGWVTDGDVLHVTSDGGRQWMTIRPGPPFAHVGQLDFISPQTGWAAGRPLFLPVLLKTLDGGHTWESLPYTISR